MKLLSFAILILCFSCSKVKESKIELDFDKKIEFLEFSNFTDSLNYIHLETNKKNLIGRIDQLYKDDELIIILDKKQKTVFIFNETGQYISKISEIGKGPGEYISITSLCIDRKRNVICLLDDMQQKIIRYNYSGNLLSEIDYESSTIVRSFSFLNDKYILFTPEYLSRTRDGVWAIDTLGNFVDEIKDVDPKYKYPSSPFPYYSCYDNDNVSFYDCNTEEIYSISDKLDCQYSFDFKQKLPEEYHKSDDVVFTKEGKIRGSGNYYRINKISECDNYFYLEFYSTLNPSMYVLLEKETEMPIVLESLKNNLDDSVTGSSIFSYDKNVFALIQWKENKNPSLQLLYMKKGLK